MAGKSNKSKNKGKGAHSTSSTPQELQQKSTGSLTLNNDGSECARASNGDANGVEVASSQSLAVDGNARDEVQHTEAAATPSKHAEGAELHLYPVSIKALSGEKLELQLSPGDSVMDVRQFLLDAPETCFFTCYDLILHDKDGSVHHLEDYNEISEVADITSGGCCLEMVATLYDDRSIRSHIARTRELLSLSSLQTSLSTLLAMQHENSQKTSENVKVESIELDGLGFMEDITSSPSDFMKSPSSREIKCVESLVFSSFNPPPSYRRLVGDLIYLDVVSLEGNKYCITGTTGGFYVNSSTANILDPKLSKPSYEANTLIGLLQKISSKFKKGFREILDRKASSHPFESVQSLLPPNIWLGVHPLPDHKRDPARAEDAFSLTFGSELIGMQRDWNEELQSCRELPHKAMQERILRGRALYKVTCDFVDAAIKGAIGVISRCIPPINPTDPECFHMYVHNNIFFSFAVDADLGYISKNQDLDLQLNSQHVAEKCDDKVSCNSLAIRSGDKPFGATGIPNPCMPTSPDKEQLRSVSDLVSDVSSESQVTDNEQATYASANNDLKGTKAYQEADVSGLYNLAMAIVDYRGYRVVAQSIIPGILQGDKSHSLLYGSVDNGKKISWDESFHSKVVEAAKRLHLKEHTVLDGSGNAVKLAAPVECKGIVGSDDRHYLLDLMRVTPRDANYVGPAHRFCVLRPELIASFCEVAALEKSQSSTRGTAPVPKAPNSQDVSSAESADKPMENAGHMIANEECIHPSAGHSTSSEDSEQILFNPNVFTEFKLASSQEEIAADEAIVRKVGSYLVDVVIPKFVQDLCSLEVSPMDGQTLAESLHAHGINIRYLGKVANMVKHLTHLWDMCSTEIIVRSTKHILKDLLRETMDHDLGPTISHFLNCFIGSVSTVGTKGSDIMPSKTQKKAQENNQSPQKSSKGLMKRSRGAFSRTNHFAMHLTSEGLWSHIQEFAKYKYQFELPYDAKIRVKKIPVIRNLCQKVGITIAARKYDLDASLPFQTSDVLNLQPVVKHSVPLCSEAKDLMELGKARLTEGLLNEAHILFSEAFSILQQITGPLHRDVACCCRYLAMVLYHAGDVAGAIVQQHKELIINERCLGLDHPDTAHSYGNMALFYHGLNQTELALRHMSRTLLLLSLSSGPDHPDVAATFINVAMMYQEIGNMKTALRYLQEALKKNERLLGSDHIQTAVCYHALAIACNCMGAFKLSIQHEKKTYDILVKQLGEEDSRTRDSENWIKTFTLREQQANVQKQKGQAVDPVSALKTLDFLKANPELVQAFQAAARSGNANSAINKSVSAAIVGETLPRGKGGDERAARAAAEVRKKAAAKGIPLRQNIAPVQQLPSLSQLLSIINSSSTVSTTSHQEDNPRNEASNGPAADSCVGVSEPNGPTTEDQAPVGLGASLASLASKKQKSKP